MGVKTMSYEQGFEDCAELCYTEADEGKDKDDVMKRLRYIVGLVKQKKFDRLKRMLESA